MRLLGRVAGDRPGSGGGRGGGGRRSRLGSPGVESRDVVLVTGPWLAGTTSLIDVLRERLPEHTFVEADELGPAAPPPRWCSWCPRSLR